MRVIINSQASKLVMAQFFSNLAFFSHQTNYDVIHQISQTLSREKFNSHTPNIRRFKPINICIPFKLDSFDRICIKQCI